MDKSLNIIFKGEVGDNQSWGISTIGNVEGFLELGHKVCLLPTNMYGDTPQRVTNCINETQDNFHAYIRQGLAEHMSELAHVPRPIRRISLSCWDSDLIKPETAEIHNRYVDGVIALSSFTKKAFIDAGVTIPVHVGGQGVDTRLFRPRTETTQERDTYKFLFVGVAQGRKGTQELISTFEKTFGDNPKVQLIIKSNSWGHLRDFGFKYKNIVPLYEEYSREEMVSLYQECDCFVLPTQGDSFMLPGLEASACGLPLIITGFGGPKDYCTDETGYPLKYTLKEAGYLPGHQATPDVEHLSNILDHVFTHQDEAREKGIAGAKSCSERWSWAHDASRNIEFLRNLQVRGDL